MLLLKSAPLPRHRLRSERCSGSATTTGTASTANVNKGVLSTAGRRRLPLAHCAPPPSPPPFTTTTPAEEQQQAEDVRQRKATAVPAPQPAPQQEHCDFYSHWWPVMPAVDLDPARPQAVDLLGMSLVLWCDKQGAWHCFQDRCPHRLAPLSEGVVQGDRLMCTYHGWEFSKAGKCEAIPQIEDPKALATACASTRNCVQAYPVKVMQGLLWVYPKPGVVGETEAASKPVPSMAIPSLLPGDGRFFQATGWFMREMPLRFETLTENILDLGHVPFAHHNAAGISKKRNVNPELTVPDYGQVGPTGFAVRRPAVPAARAKEYDLRLEAPAHASYVYCKDSDGYNQHFIVVPTKPGWSKLFLCMVGCNDAQVPAPLKALGKFIAAMPALEHVLLRHEVLDGDTYLLHMAERGLMAAGNDTRAYFMPMNADLPVVMWRKWLAKHAPVVPTCTKADEAFIPAALPRQQVLDRWHQHTRHCKACQGALKTLDRGMVAAQVVGALALLATVPAVATGAWPLTSAPAITGAVLAALSAAVYNALKSFRPNFFFTDYVHVDRYAKP